MIQKSIFLKLLLANQIYKTVAPGTWRPRSAFFAGGRDLFFLLGRNTLRISFGYDTNGDDVERLVSALSAFCLRSV